MAEKVYKIISSAIFNLLSTCYLFVIYRLKKERFLIDFFKVLNKESLENSRLSLILLNAIIFLSKQKLLPIFLSNLSFLKSLSF